MGYQYSHLIDPRSYDSQGLCDGIPLRVHRNADLAEAGIIRLRNDWRRYVGPLPLNSFGGGMGPVYNFPSVAIPECHPNRLEIVSYITEFGFLHDDIVDKPKANEGAALDTKSGRERIRSNIVNEIMSIDPLRAKEFIAIWTKGFGVGQDRTHFIDFDDYLHYRVVGRGSFFMTSLTIFGMCLTIPPEEKEEFWRITRPAWAAAVLTNDLQSWDKEWRLFQTQDETDMANGIWVLMKQYSIEIDDAKIMSYKD
ncbi:hypothetical protein GQX73_g3439 [Xylaria multiplex]|uniref:Fusicoccadiene synthase n=1 Tax=Xylaria multiplex TaxID=323545 RepID=A0A7C8MS40_9PEZI|nr:hypothetical protein GQX73_g3439 [Xylaria multiplex]